MDRNAAKGIAQTNSSRHINTYVVALHFVSGRIALHQISAAVGIPGLVNRNAVS